MLITKFLKQKNLQKTSKIIKINTKIFSHTLKNKTLKGFQAIHKTHNYCVFIDISSIKEGIIGSYDIRKDYLDWMFNYFYDHNNNMFILD